MPTAIRVLILEDRPEDAELMVQELRRGGFDPMWQRVDTEADYLAWLTPDLSVILADYNLPQFSALRGLWLLQDRCYDVPFIVVSGFIGEDVAVATIRKGAADYLLKDRLARLAPAVRRALEDKRLRDEKSAAETALRATERTYREIFENAVEGIYQSTPQGQFRTVNPAMARMLGYSGPEELMAAVPNVAGQLYVDPGRFDEFVRLLEENDSVRGFECRLYRRNRSEIWVSLNVRVVRDESGRLLHYSGSVLDITEAKAAEAAVQQYQVELQDLAARLIHVQEAETRRLSRELHDVFSQKLAVVGIELGLLRTRPPDSASVLQERLRRICEQIAELASGLHQTSRNLHPAVLDDLGLSVALTNECAAFAGQHGIEVKCTSRKVPDHLPDGVSLCLFRIAQESLGNIRKHARARQAQVSLRGGGGEIVLTIEDDGRGFVRSEVRGRGGLGLVSMEERVRLVDGRLSITSKPGGGTRVEVRVPSKNRESAR